MTSKTFAIPLMRSRILLSLLAVGGLAVILSFGGPAFAAEDEPAAPVESPTLVPTPSLEASPSSGQEADSAPSPDDVPTQAETTPTPTQGPSEEHSAGDGIDHLVMSPLQAYPGEKVRVTGQCGTRGYPYMSVWLGLSDQTTGTTGGAFSAVEVDEHGMIDTEVTLSPSSTPGTYKSSWMCASFDAIVAWSEEDLEFTVLGALTPPTQTPTPTENGGSSIDDGGTATTNGPAELAESGNSGQQWPLVLAAGILTVGGGSFVAIARRATWAETTSSGA